ncbi:FMN reductase OS=Streptomyces fumanus OX=67302 GN=GCM10018772_56730 PE=4 SV=1 [Streptomyces fumanus]
MGGASAGFHALAEATSRRFIEGRWADKLAAGFTNSASKSGDKSNTLAFFAALAAQHQMLWVSLGLAPGWNSTTASENDLNRLGFWAGAGAQTPWTAGRTPSTRPTSPRPSSWARESPGTRRR